MHKRQDAQIRFQCQTVLNKLNIFFIRYVDQGDIKSIIFAVIDGVILRVGGSDFIVAEN